MMIKTTAPLMLALAMLAGALPAYGAQRNALIGKWTLASGDCPAIKLEYTAAHSREWSHAIGPYPAAWTGRDVIYNVTPRRIWVLAKQRAYVYGQVGQLVRVIDANHILPDSAGQCTYARTR